MCLLSWGRNAQTKTRLKKEQQLGNEKEHDLGSRRIKLKKRRGT